VDAPFRDMGKDRKIPVMIEEEMKLDRSFRLAERGPIKERGAEVDDGGVETEKLVLETELLLSRGDGPALVKKLIKHLLIELPGPFLIGIG